MSSLEESFVGIVQEAVQEETGIPIELMRAKTRKRPVVDARHLAMYLCKEFTKLSLKTIGQEFGGRDHSTVIHACQNIENRMEVEHAFKAYVFNIRALLRPRIVIAHSPRI